MSSIPTPNLPPLPIPHDVEQGHARYLATEFNIDAATGGPVDPSSNTNKGHQLDGTNNLHEAAARLADGSELLRSSLQVLNDPDAGKTSKIAASRTIKKCASLMTAAADVSSDAARVVSPLPGTQVAHRRLQTMRANEVRKANKKAGRKSATIDPRVAMIDEFVGREGSPAASKSPRKIASAKRKRLPTRAKRRDDAIPDPPAPSNGKDEYGVGEFLRIRSLVHPKKRRKLVLKMKTMGYVPVSERALYRLYEAVDRGERFALDEPWRGNGRPPKIHNSKLKEITARLSACQGRKEMKTKVNEILVEEERKKGIIVEAGKKMNSTTVNTYTALLVSSSKNLTITDGSIAKSNNRFAVEDSLIEAVCYTVVVAMTHFYVAETEDVEWRETLATIPKEDRLLYELVCAFHDGKPVRPRPSWAILSSDDTGEVATVGLQPDNSRKVGLVAKSALAKSGTKSLYHVERSTKLNYRRCKRHFISNANGDYAPAVWIFKCSASEMPVESEDFIVWKVPGLCVGGYGVGGSREPGYVIFYRDNVKGQEKRRFRWVREHILFPFISRIRKNHGFDDSTGAHIPEAFKFVSWCDGDNSQLFTITEEEAIQAYVDHGVTCCKHGASGSAVQQGDDLSGNFTSSKSFNKKNTIVHVPSEDHDLKRALERQFKAEKALGRLFFDKPRNAVDYLGKQPANLTICCMPEKIIKGYTANGQLDRTKKIMPTFMGCIGTCKTPAKPHQYELILRIFKTLLDYSYNNGMRYIDDGYLLSLGLPASVDMEGKQQIKTQGISQECQQRAKCLTAPAEVAKRAKRLEEIDLREKRLAETNKAMAQQKWDEDAALVQTLCAAAGKEANPENLVHCTLEHFAAQNADPLRSFISWRHDTMKTVTATKSLKKPQGKKALDDAKAGVENVVLVAWTVRTKPSRALAEAEAEAAEAAAAAVAVAAPTYVSPSITAVPLRPVVQEARASSIFVDPPKLALLLSMFDSLDILRRSDTVNSGPFTPIDPNHQQFLQKVDLLASMLQNRLDAHIISPRVQPSDRRHWVWTWIRKNLFVVAAHMMCFDHVKKSIQFLDESECLLARPVEISRSSGQQARQPFAVMSEQTKIHYGCYLHHDDNKGAWVRSGSATGDGGFGKRLTTHARMARADTNANNSLFYHSYPHSESARASSRGIQGHFDDLDVWVGMYFTADAASRKDFSNGGLFLYANEERATIARAALRGKEGEWRYLLLAAYLFELGYDVAMAPKDSVSTSPGCEAFGVSPTSFEALREAMRPLDAARTGAADRG